MLLVSGTKPMGCVCVCVCFGMFSPRRAFRHFQKENESRDKLQNSTIQKRLPWLLRRANNLTSNVN